MRNKYPGTCYRCGQTVGKGQGHFEKVKGTYNSWRVQHASCAIKHREKKESKKQLINLLEELNAKKD